MNKQREDMLWDTLDFLAKTRLKKEDFGTYTIEKPISCREVLTKFVHDCIESYGEEI